MNTDLERQKDLLNCNKKIELDSWRLQHECEIIEYFNKYGLIRNSILVNEAQRYRKNKFKDKDSKIFYSLNEEILNKDSDFLIMQSLSAKRLFNENA